MFHYLRRKLFHLYSFQNPSLKSFSQLSNSTNQPSFKVSYLINSCGLSKEAALKVAQRVDFETEEKPDSVLSFFRSHDLTQTHISNIITKCPRLLLSNPNKTLKPKVEFFLGLGIPAPELARTLCGNPYMLRISLENHIIPIFYCLKSILHTNKDIIYLFRKARYLIQCNPQKTLEPNLTTLQNYGVPDSRILTLMKTYPAALGLKSDHFSEVVAKVKEMGFDPSDSSFVVAIVPMSVTNKSTWEGKLEVYRSFGWTEEEILSAFKKEPRCMITSGKKLKRVMDFFANQMDLKPSFLSRHPKIFLLSFEKRIRPRCSVLHILMSKGILNDLKLSTALNLSESKFIEKYVTKNKERVPEIVSVYQGKTAVTGLDIGSIESDAVQKLFGNPDTGSRDKESAFVFSIFHHSGLFGIILAFDLTCDQLGVTVGLEVLCPSRPKFIPTIRASFSASLLEALKQKRRAYCRVNPFGLIRKRPAPLPCELDEPSTKRLWFVSYVEFSQLHRLVHQSARAVWVVQYLPQWLICQNIDGVGLKDAAGVVDWFLLSAVSVVEFPGCIKPVSFISYSFLASMFWYFRRKLFHIYSFQNPSLKSISQLSNSTKPSFKVSYLINSCGLSEEAALKVAQRVDFETAEKPDSVLAFFRSHDLTKTHISNIITKCPILLVSNPDKTLKPKFEFFLGLGISAPVLARIVNPYLFKRSLENQIIPTFDFLKSILHPNKDIILALRLSRNIIQVNTQKVLQPNITTLRNHGVPDSRILTLIMTNSRALSLKSDRFSEVVTEVKEMGFNPSSSLFVLAVITMSVMSKPTWERKLEVFRSFGWSYDEILSAFKKQPWCIITSEKKVKMVMDVFINKMDLKPSFLSKNPNLFLFSLEKRIRPRCSVLQVLMSEDILKKDLKLYSELRLSEKEFVEKYVTKNKERLPELLSLYQGKTADI
ncbi:uncharacterized protein LOC143888869 [Tasmannia lanceolata]|uniref:uncharacterized protein LOC143888869 n=1 Tax=Tasmannia lanceolata TaxID=3420 RepID=UPI004062A3D6